MLKNDYKHKVQYYETDQMGVVHHSNYIRWFEEARVEFMEWCDMGYAKMEEEGIMSPVLEANAKYLKMVKFGESVLIRTTIEEYDGIRLTVSYEIFNEETKEMCCTGYTKHCFLGENGKLVSLKRANEDFHQMFLAELKK